MKKLKGVGMHKEVNYQKYAKRQAVFEHTFLNSKWYRAFTT